VAVKRAAERMGEAEGRLAGLDTTGAIGPQTGAIEALRSASVLLPPALAALVGKLHDDQTSLLPMTRADDPALLPAEEREIGFWLALLARLPDPPDPPEEAPPAPEGQPTISKEVVAKIRSLASEAAAAADRAAGHLEGDRLEESVPEQETVVAKLEEIAKLLPRPPESPADRIRKLIVAEREVAEGVEALPGMNRETRVAEAGALAGAQRGHGREAGSVAEELTSSPGEREKQAGEKVRDAEEEIFSSGESLVRDRVEPAAEAVDRAIGALTEALALLTGDQRQEQQGDEGDQGRKGEEEQREEKSQDARRLDARQARRMMEEMDRERREEERKLFRGVGGPKVDKDW